jgi:hypothetical protein
MAFSVGFTANNNLELQGKALGVKTELRTPSDRRDQHDLIKRNLVTQINPNPFGMGRIRMGL